MSTNPPQKHRRPLAITIVVWVLLLGALANIVIGIFLVLVDDNQVPRNLGEVVIFAESDPDTLTIDGAELADGIYNLIAGVVQLVIAVGFWRERRWAWVFAMSWQAFKLLIELATPFSNEDKVPIMFFSIVLIFLLNQSDVRRVFSIQRSENAPSSSKPLNILDVN